MTYVRRSERDLPKKATQKSSLSVKSQARVKILRGAPGAQTGTAQNLVDQTNIDLGHHISNTAPRPAVNA